MKKNFKSTRRYNNARSYKKFKSVFMTPNDFRKDYNSLFGSGFSISPIFKQSAWFRFHNKSENFKNLYFVGAGCHPGAGVPGVISSAKVLRISLKMNESLANLSIEKRAKTFYFASLFFSKKIQDDIKILYFFCRLIDIGDKNPKNSELALDQLKRFKKDIYNQNSSDKIISEFIGLMTKYNINPWIPIDLINGVMGDLKKVEIRNFLN